MLGAELPRKMSSKGNRTRISCTNPSTSEQSPGSGVPTPALLLGNVHPSSSFPWTGGRCLLSHSPAPGGCIKDLTHIYPALHKHPSPKPAFSPPNMYRPALVKSRCNSLVEKELLKAADLLEDSRTHVTTLWLIFCEGIVSILPRPPWAHAGTISCPVAPQAARTAPAWPVQLHGFALQLPHGHTWSMAQHPHGFHSLATQKHLVAQGSLGHATTPVSPQHCPFSPPISLYMDF